MIDILGFLGEQRIAPPHVHIIDVGAMMIGANPWDALVQQRAATVTGFEPQADECARLEENAGPNHRYLPYALGDGARRRFHRCNAPMTSSMYEPNLKLAGRFQRLAEFMQVVEVSEIPTTRLDDVPEARGADLVKLDAQGFEHTILEHADAVLEAALIVQTEVCFVPLYKEQPLFADVDRLLRSRGFMLHTMLGIGTRTFKPLVVGGDLHAGLNQYLWSDAVYVRDPEAFADLTPEALLKLAILLHATYRSVDLVAVVLGQYDRLAGTRLTPAYLRALTAGGARAA